MTAREKAGFVVVATAGGCLAVVMSRFRRDMTRHERRIANRSTVITTEWGDVEYTEGGTGPDVLVIHGAGGGFDQGELLAAAMLGGNVHHITPSRFGYLRSTCASDATWDEQAHSYAALLDHLGISRVSVVAFSAGGSSGLLFALLHPDRVSSLTLVSCGGAKVPQRADVLAQKQSAALLAIVRYDLPYWIVTHLFERRFMQLMGATSDIVAGLTTDQRDQITSFIEWMNPARLRHVGAEFDYRSEVPDRRVAGIRVPTLVIHAADDTLQPFANAELFSSAIPDARLLRFERGGHFVAFIEQHAVRAAVRDHITSNLATGETRHASA